MRCVNCFAPIERHPRFGYLYCTSHCGFSTLPEPAPEPLVAFANGRCL